MAKVVDVFGIQKLYKENPNGPQWDALHWNNGKSRTVISGSKDPYDTTQCSENRGNVNWTIDGKGSLLFNASCSGTTEPRFHLNKPDTYFFQDVEATFYMMRVKDNNTNWGGPNIGVRSGPNGHSIPSEYCDAHTYYQRLRYDGNMDFEKELKHPDSSVQCTHNIWNGGKFPFNKWIGYKSITRNAGNGVKLQLFMDVTEGVNGGTWVKLGEYADVSNWSPPQEPPACPYPANYVPLKGGGVIVMRNTGVTDARYKWMTVREITSSMYDEEDAVETEKRGIDDGVYMLGDQTNSQNEDGETHLCTTEHIEPSTECINCKIDDNGNMTCEIPTNKKNIVLRTYDYIASFF